MCPRRIKTTLILIILIAIIFTGCAQAGDPPEDNEPVMGLANPASVYCQGLGYMEETRKDELGKFGVCIFPDESECDTWDFLAGRCGQEHSYCTKQGYELVANDESNIGTCVFDDGSTCSEFSFFEKDCTPGENMP